MTCGKAIPSPTYYFMRTEFWGRKLLNQKKHFHTVSHSGEAKTTKMKNYFLAYTVGHNLKEINAKSDSISLDQGPC